MTAVAFARAAGAAALAAARAATVLAVATSAAAGAVGPSIGALHALNVHVAHADRRRRAGRRRTRSASATRDAAHLGVRLGYFGWNSPNADAQDGEQAAVRASHMAHDLGVTPTQLTPRARMPDAFRCGHGEHGAQAHAEERAPNCHVDDGEPSAARVV